MSFFFTQAWRAFHAGRLTRTERDVALNLAHYANRGFAWPSHATLAARARCCARSVRRALVRLRDLGLLAWCQRRDRHGCRTSNLYWFSTSGQNGQGSESQIIPSYLSTGARELLDARQRVIERQMAERYARFH